MCRHDLKKVVVAIVVLLCSAQIMPGGQKAKTISPNRQVTKCPASTYVLEPAKCVPVAYDADVVVAGGGFSGIAAALAAARQGAKTVLIERQGAVGGSFGPGMHFQKVFLQDDPNKYIKGAPYDYVKGEVTAITKEFAENFFALHAGRKSCSLADSKLCSYMTLKML